MKAPGSAKDPLWYKDAIIYETHVRAFFDANNDGIGDFPGLIQKLDYLQELGITCLWLLPFFPSPLRDDGYDISDYANVHPSYGTIEDFRAFLHEAHERNLQVIIELVLNHTSDEHPWFQAARNAPPGSLQRDFYVWSDDDQKYRGSRIIFTDAEKSNWTWDPVAKAYYWHRFFSHQPDLNFDNPAVLDAVLKAMKFWLDLGVDGLRLDAIPYLLEREGTNCENLPETHAILKKMRQELDTHYSSRMFLAEANQWPTDVVEYFGEGDECHMTFHFPLMPRIFMALRLEDRHPVTEIMAQTPAIPESCQWGIFLRNHDELTLEMVTDEERDYMYFAYSSDPRMRLNLGIRRRLAPLMENNRRRIELLNSLLFSFPGTPILYYGDEIGMGDNIYLGDRNGVRTPMQWSADRNGGFSRANPARLYSALVMDAIYGYEAVNVEAQHSDPSSLLNWMRNMLALRKLFKVFSRGSIEFFHPANRKILAYLRRYGDEQVLCVANLSRFAQPAELDLSALAGLIPVEMIGYSEFPTIGPSPYPLTLGPYGFYWFELQRAPVPIEIEEAQKVAAGEPAELVIENGCSGLLEGAARETLETRFLPQFLPAQRWFGSKTRTIHAVRIKDWALLTEDPSPSVLLIADVDYADDASDTYFVPLAIAVGDPSIALQKSKPEAILCKIRFQNSDGVLYDATMDEASCAALLAAIGQGHEFPAQHGVIRAFPTTAFQELGGEAQDGLKIVRGSAEQSNTSILYGDRLIFKLFRRLQPGPNPDFEIGLHLTERVRFDRIPALAGAMEYTAEGAPAMTLGMLQPLVSNQGDAWQWTLEELGRYYEQCATFPEVPAELVAQGHSPLKLSEAEVPPAAAEKIGMYLQAVAILGQRTAELHLALAAPTEDPAFAPEPVTPGDLERWGAALTDHAVKALEELKEHLPHLPDDIVDKAGLLLSRRRRLLDSFQTLRGAEAGFVKIRIHGDYHLGQVLWVNNDYVILDFEGEPARPLAERRAKAPVLKDLAGMLRSFSYAAYGELLAHASRRPDDFERLHAWADCWERWVSAVFLKSYRQTAAGAAFLPADFSQFHQILDLFLLDKALYELHYEMNNRPNWVPIPLWGILGLAEDLREGAYR